MSRESSKTESTSSRTHSHGCQPAQLDASAIVALCPDDVVFEFPFAPPGRPARVEGKEAIGDYLESISGHLRIDDVRELEIRETVKPDVAIIEITVAGTMTTTGEPCERSYVIVLTVRDGLLARYRDYWNPLQSAE
ncbi:nuclear transport factor 2 family protein [Saccharomonospora piscinae]|uniref:nuclear transport factor 2 family protein n=1 Tax=Saccharomonospora piscinae TaxID=687388 RepID=UPI0004638A36|nr:nuclear transport factor 2 family protein [Saccharomonospora piscinae]